MKLLSCYLSLFFIFVSLTAQMKIHQNSRTINGLVTSQEDSSPLEGVSVSVKGTGKPSGTQPDGQYYIEVSDKDSVLVFSLNEFQTREVRLTDAREYNVVLNKKPSSSYSLH